MDKRTKIEAYGTAKKKSLPFGRIFLGVALVAGLAIAIPREENKNCSYSIGLEQGRTIEVSGIKQKITGKTSDGQQITTNNNINYLLQPHTMSNGYRIYKNRNGEFIVSYTSDGEQLIPAGDSRSCNIKVGNDLSLVGIVLNNASIAFFNTSTEK